MSAPDSIAFLLALVAGLLLLRFWFWRGWLAGRFTLTQGALILSILTAPRIGIAFVVWYVLRGTLPPELLVLALWLPIQVPFVQWMLKSFAPAPGSGGTDAPSLLEEDVLGRVHRD